MSLFLEYCNMSKTHKGPCDEGETMITIGFECQYFYTMYGFDGFRPRGSWFDGYCTLQNYIVNSDSAAEFQANYRTFLEENGAVNIRIEAVKGQRIGR